MSPRSAPCSTGYSITATYSSVDLEAGAPRLHRHRKETSFALLRGLCPRAPGIYRFPARMAAGRGGLRRPPFRSWNSALVASLRCHVLRPGLASISFSGRTAKYVCRNGHRRVINTLVLVQLRWPVLKWPCMAGFQVAAEVSRREPDLSLCRRKLARRQGVRLADVARCA